MPATGLLYASKVARSADLEHQPVRKGLKLFLVNFDRRAGKKSAAVKNGDPSEHEQNVAANAFPAAHPLRSVPGDAVRGCLDRIARAKTVLPEPQILGTWQGKIEEANAISSVNHQGTQLLMRKGDAVSVFDLCLDDSPPTLTQVLTRAPVEPPEEECSVEPLREPADCALG
ncbi:hypothetical protein WJX73_003142 [Symbiochloris irregularis]|uniref:Uncharacterized protein n=1 Tax=Symbiochloris irregularis TaxID=706552 RepID=A0AAW1NTV5_9CHLO